MRKYMMCTALILTVTFGSAFAETATVDVPSEDVEATNGLLTITVSLPAGAVDKRLGRAVLEIPIVVGESANELFNEFPMLQLYEDGSDLPKQTVMLAQGHSGVVRIDVTRFVREWSGVEERALVLGTVSEDNDTAFELGSVGWWPNGTKARLTVEYMDRDGTSVVADVE
jgi:hypothetical protein